MKKSKYSDPKDGKIHKTAEEKSLVEMAEIFNPQADVERRLTGLEQLFRQKKALSKDQFASLGKLMLDPNEDQTLRMMAIHILGRSKDERALELLKDLFCQVPQFPARHLIIKALGDLGLLEARQIIVEALATEDKIGDRTHAASALEYPDIRPEERQALKTAVLGDASELVQLAALRVLARAKQDSEFLQTVTGMTGLPNNVRILARKGLERAPRPIA